MPWASTKGSKRSQVTSAARIRMTTVSILLVWQAVRGKYDKEVVGHGIDSSTSTCQRLLPKFRGSVQEFRIQHFTMLTLRAAKFGAWKKAIELRLCTSH